MSVTQPNVHRFFDAVSKYGFNKKYNFQIEDITGLPDNISNLVNSIPDYTLYIQSAKVPARKINTVKVPYKAFEFVVPTNASYPDSENWEVEFISDSDMLIRNLFEQWSFTLYDNSTNSTSNIDFAKCNLTLNLLTETIEPVGNNNEVTTTSEPLNTIRTYTLYGVFPVNLNPIEYNITDAGTEVVKFRATMAFQYFTVQ